MLDRLTIRQFTLIEELDIEFGRGLNIITGETGAGKSIIVDALLLLFGERGSAEYVRKGAAKAIIEGSFRIAGNQQINTILQEYEIEHNDNVLLLRREISEKGTSRSFINDSPVPLGVMRLLGEQLVDFHGQHEHQSLLRPEAHVRFLDAFEEVEPHLKAYEHLFATLRAQLHEAEDLAARQQSLREQAEFRRFQLEEITQINPQPHEEEQLEQELALRENAERLYDLTYRLATLLYDAEDSVHDRLVHAKHLLEELAHIDKEFLDYQRECQSAITMVGEIAKHAQRYRDTIEFQPERLEEIRYRLQQLARLRKKYGGTAELFAKWEELKNDVMSAEDIEHAHERIQHAIENTRVQLAEAAYRLSEQRKRVAARVEKTVVTTLQTLGMPHIRFAVNFSREVAVGSGMNEMFVLLDGERVVAYPNGAERVEFLIAANPGEDLKPLARIASGGEISRVMLALKAALAESERLPMMVFDEIDTGISGRIAQKVGKTMKELSKYPQIIAITHQPQIAALADTHIMVEKRQTATSTRISAVVLTAEERVYEVARLLSGEEITNAALEGARELVRAE
ncbi:MAG: DNA repair protein RecN [Bacteroidota bacterium]|nr:DNA repair protein RecN [Candidatus Kapabacteria bacterium]MDW8219167.1 DNA repair protein RecN [Bacteroidota bacterium]